MIKAVELAKKIALDISQNYHEEFFLLNLHNDFKYIYNSGYSLKLANTIAAYIIFAYDNDSPWLDLQKDRFENKKKILSSLDASYDNGLFSPILTYDDDDVQEVILNYLINQTDARWQEIISLLDYADKMILFANKKTKSKSKTGSTLNKEGAEEDEYEYLNEGEVAKVNKDKGDLLLKAIETRKKAEELIQQIKNDFVKLDHAIQQDFDFSFTDLRKFDITSWEQRLLKRKHKKNTSN